MECSRILFLIFITAFIKHLPKCVMVDYFNSEEDLHGDNVRASVCNMPRAEVSIKVFFKSMDIISTKCF